MLGFGTVSWKAYGEDRFDFVRVNLDVAAVCDGNFPRNEQPQAKASVTVLCWIRRRRTAHQRIENLGPQRFFIHRSAVADRKNNVLRIACQRNAYRRISDSVTLGRCQQGYRAAAAHGYHPSGRAYYRLGEFNFARWIGCSQLLQPAFDDLA